MNAETASHGPHVPAEQLQGCLDELKQKLQNISLASRSTEVSDTASHPALKRQKKVHHDDFTKEEVFDNDADSSNGNSDLPRSLESNKEITLLSQRRSLPLIYSIMNNPSVDKQDDDIWGYVRTYVHTVG